MKQIFLLFSALYALAASPAYAGGQSGKVVNLQVRASDHLIVFDLNGGEGHNQRPACANKLYWMIKDENSASGKRQLALLMAAQMSGRTVMVYGANTCTRWPDGEDVDAVIIQ